MPYPQSFTTVTGSETRNWHSSQNKKPLSERGASYVKALVLILFSQGTSRTPFVITQDEWIWFFTGRWLDGYSMDLEKKKLTDIGFLDFFVGYRISYKNLLNGFLGFWLLIFQLVLDLD